jgi:aryl-alcohol dehydrogenase-like predicted oxidoreductase
MNFCHAYQPPLPEAEAERLLLAALDAGVTHFDTAALYGFGVSETIVGKVLAPHRDRFMLASKCGMTVEQGDGTVKSGRVIDGRPAALRATAEGSLRRLRTDVIDLYYLHRWDKAVPIEDSVGELSRLVAEGKVDMQKLASENLANRGLDATGKWVGFRQASAVHQQHIGAQG